MSADADHHTTAGTVQVDLLLAAAAAAPGPPGPPRWFPRPLDDGVELRSVVRSWAADGDRAGRTMRIAAGAALRNVRISLAAQGRRAVCAYPQRDALLAAVRTGEPYTPSALDLALARLVSTGSAPEVPVRDPAVTRALLRRAADADQVWVRVLPGPLPAADPQAIGVPWARNPVAMGTRPEMLVLIGAPENDRIADLRVGQAMQQIRLLSAVVLGRHTTVVAGPVDPEWWRRTDPTAGRLPRATVLLSLSGGGPVPPG
ncbi:MAG: hypothetical protein ABW212_06790 [Pseudonocardia sediminis]